MNVKKILSIFTVTMVFSSFCQFPVKANAESNNADTVIHGTGANGKYSVMIMAFQVVILMEKW